MFREAGSDYVERLDVIGNKPFIAFVEQLEKEEGMALDTFWIDVDVQMSRSPVRTRCATSGSNDAVGSSSTSRRGW